MCSIFFSKELSVYKVSFDYCMSYSWLEKFSIYFNKWTWSRHKFYLFYQSFTKNLRTVSQFLCHLHFFECWYSVYLEPGKMSKMVNCILFTSSCILSPPLRNTPKGVYCGMRVPISGISPSESKSCDYIFSPCIYACRTMLYFFIFTWQVQIHDDYVKIGNFSCTLHFLFKIMWDLLPAHHLCEVIPRYKLPS